jgi:hypothetical protein
MNEIHPDLMARALALAEHGYGPIPLATKAKAPEPGGFQGQKNPLPSFADWYAVVEADPERWGNLGVRYPVSVIALDVDLYKGGDSIRWDTLRSKLPATVVINARADEGGHWLYRLPETVDQADLPTGFGAGEILRFGHRYSMAPGSWNPDAQAEYRAIDQRTGAVLEFLPPVASLPVLPLVVASALLALRGPRRATGGHEGASRVPAGPGAAPGAPVAVPGPPVGGPPCEYLSRQAARAIEGMVEGSRHDAMTKGVWAVIAGWAEGHSGRNDALALIRDGFLEAMGDDRAGVFEEFKRAVEQALDKIEVADPLMWSCCGSVAEPGTAADEPTEAPPEPSGDLWAQAVVRRAEQFRLDREAREYDAERLGLALVHPEPVRLTDLLEHPPEDVAWRIEDLWPSGGKVLLTASAKAGKTTMVLNIERSLLTGEPFLGRFDVAPIDGSIVVFDIEMSLRQQHDWHSSLGLDRQATDRIHLVPMRGRAASFDLRSDKARDRWRKTLTDRGCSVIVVDPLGPVLAGLGMDENSNSEVAVVLAGLDALAADVGADLLVVHHHGHSATRARGASAFEGWPDALWRLDRKDEDTEPADDLEALFSAPLNRTFAAVGRDVLVAETPLAYEPEGRLLGLVSGTVSTKAERERRDKDQADIEILVGLVAARHPEPFSPGTKAGRVAWSEAAKENGGRSGVRALEGAVRGAMNTGRLRGADDGLVLP